MKFLKDNQILDIAEAKVKDAKDLLVFLSQVQEENEFIVLKDSGLHKTLEEQETYLTELKNKVTSKLFIGKVKNQIVASGGIYHRDKSLEGNVVLDINVLKDYLGIGTEEHMLNHVINYARITTEIRSIDILTTDKNKNLIGIYQSIGFKLIEHDDISLKPDKDQLVYRLVIK
ncbi:GNAT family N-acetyltransferase [Hujiaoplasma nucleasis]|uniref:GNAT family N-acetyltransferase n=1 Tax=Hujiaoplasma nucleasis TaxID=2725268 RepID=A0A7L6N2K9_9MOLU|nr:GNAT family N-acetyltransferase [Hujiaoplasma nucleasis]QLY39791.1 GNAT family N-acetyltransferase [Hujiaoplasma nucleasis]